jgi:hypothetical protein
MFYSMNLTLSLSLFVENVLFILFLLYGTLCADYFIPICFKQECRSTFTTLLVQC